MEQNVALIERLYRAFAASDMTTLAGTFATDVEMVQVGRNALAGQFRGREAVFGHFADIPRFTDALTMAPRVILAGAGGEVAALNRMTIKKAGAEREFQVVHLCSASAMARWSSSAPFQKTPTLSTPSIGSPTEEPTHAAG